MTYAPERAALLPEVIDRAAAGDFGPLLATAQAAVGGIDEQITPALHYAVICSEDAPRVTPAERREPRAVAQPRAGGEHVRRLRDLAARERPRRTARAR